MRPLGVWCSRRMAESERSPLAGAGTKCTKPTRRRVAVVAEREHRVAVIGRVHVVERHREAALRLAAQPRAADALDLAPLLERQLARAHDARGVAGLLQARDRLAHLADRPALEREARRMHDRLVADVDRAQADRVPVGEVLARDAEHRHAPGVRVAVPREVGQQRRGGRGVADRIARHERHAADGAVGEEGRALLVEEVRLVAAQREVGERVAAVALDQPARVAAIGRRPG